MKCTLIIISLFFIFNCKAQTFQYDYPGKLYYGEEGAKMSKEKSDNQWLDFKSLGEMQDSSVKYRDLYECSRKCYKRDSIRYYYGRTMYFINQSEWYCAILYGADSVKKVLYYQPGDIIPPPKCICTTNM